MFDKLNTLFNFDKSDDNINSLNKKFEDIPTIIIPQNDKKNILILDDNEESGHVTILDLKMLNTISEKIRTDCIDSLSDKHKTFVSTLNQNSITKLKDFSIDDFNIILVTGSMAAFSIFEALDNGLNIDYAILDILLGGNNIYKGKPCVLDGIDVVNKLVTHNKYVKYLFYSGCSINSDTDENIKFKNLMGENINKYLIIKNKDFVLKRKKFFELLIS